MHGTKQQNRTLVLWTFLTHRQIFTGRKTKRSLGTELDPLMAPEQLIVSERGKELAGARQGPHVEGVQESDYLEVDLFRQAKHISFWRWSRFSGRRWRLTERVHGEQTWHLLLCPGNETKTGLLSNDGVECVDAIVHFHLLLVQKVFAHFPYSEKGLKDVFI
jgi:hypothetical protein